jgi:hypothetical protein
MAAHCNVAIVYGETKLHRTMSIPTSATVAQAKQAGSETILQHLRLQPGVPSAISLDDECTDFYPSKAQPWNTVYITNYLQMLWIPSDYEI